MASASLMKNHEPLLAPDEALDSSLNKDSSNGPKSVKTNLGQAEPQPVSTKRTWTRINRMEVGPLERSLSTQSSMLAKRQMEDTLENNGETEFTSLH